MKFEGQKKYALLQAASDSDYVKKVYGGYFNVFVEAYGEEGESWDLYRVIEGEFPHMDDLHKYDGFVISGSPHDAYGNECWIQRLCSLLQTLVAMRKKVLGICFGHQILCRSLGGRVDKSGTGWDLGVRKVWDVPSGAMVIASSDKTKVEMFVFGDHILGIQGHPEYSKDILCDVIDRLVKNNSIEPFQFSTLFPSMQRNHAENVKSRLPEVEPDTKRLYPSPMALLSI
ncbi:Glutamine amidotransferase [Dillenia turbinata]|uniref:Glutamine amidotransferase n=1 Tax=Dillenia turbinata TaxID=194707 RepID=A0AAN8ZID6_9MAGN